MLYYFVIEDLFGYGMYVFIGESPLYEISLGGLYLFYPFYPKIQYSLLRAIFYRVHYAGVVSDFDRFKT